MNTHVIRPTPLDLSAGCTVRPRVACGLIRRAATVSVFASGATFRVSKSVALSAVRRIMRAGGIVSVSSFQAGDLTIG